MDDFGLHKTKKRQYMSVIRVVHNRENPFVQLNKDALWDENLSLKATGLWARCLSRPDDWKFSVKELAAKSKEGRRAIYTAIDELIEHNYAIKLVHWEKDIKGSFNNGGVEYVFFEFPATQEDKDKVLAEFKKSFRHRGFGNLHDGDHRNSTLLKKEERLKTHKKKREREGASPPPLPAPPPAPFFSHKRVKMEESRFHELRNEFGHDKVMEMLERLDEYADLNPRRFKQYACHATVIRKWIREDSQKPKQKVNTKQINKIWAERLKNKFSTRNDLYIGEEGITFSGGVAQINIKYEEFGFKEQVINRLRKMGIPIEGL
jgi:hypothetical protein